MSNLYLYCIKNGYTDIDEKQFCTKGRTYHVDGEIYKDGKLIEFMIWDDLGSKHWFRNDELEYGQWFKLKEK